MLKRIIVFALFAFMLKSPAMQINFPPVESELLKPGLHQKPLWLSEMTPEAENETRGFFRYAKPVLITAAAGGVTYFLYSVRSR